jgi:hypothetical protein
MAYLVGERGPEIFRPNTSGEIIPNGSPQVTVNIVNQAGPEVQVQQQPSPDPKQLDIIISKKLNDALARGAADKTLRTAFGVTRRGVAR